MDVILPCRSELHAGFPAGGPKVLGSTRDRGEVSGSLESSDGFDVLSERQEIECCERSEA